MRTRLGTGTGHSTDSMRVPPAVASGHELPDPSPSPPLPRGDPHHHPARRRAGADAVRVAQRQARAPRRAGRRGRSARRRDRDRAPARRPRRRVRDPSLRRRDGRPRGDRGPRGLRRVRRDAGRPEGPDLDGRQPGGGPAAQPRRRRGEGARRGRRLRQARAAAASPPACCRSCSPGSSPAWPARPWEPAPSSAPAWWSAARSSPDSRPRRSSRAGSTSIGGDWLVNAGALSLTVLAVAAIVAGLETLLGKAGAALAALTMVLIGNPFSGVATGPEMLPGAAGVARPAAAAGRRRQPAPQHRPVRRRGGRRPRRGALPLGARRARAAVRLRRAQPQDRSRGRAGRGLTGLAPGSPYQRSGRRVGPTMWPPPA